MNLSTLFLALAFFNSAFAEPVPHDGRFARAEFVSSLIKPGDVGAEIGVCYGIFAYHTLLQKQPLKLYLIDPWEYGLQKDVELDPTAEKQAIVDACYKIVCDLFSPYANVEILRKKSEDAAIFFPDHFFDYVYIDGEHSYDAVKRDLSNYSPKVKVGGYLIGDDYGWTGVAPAVQEFLSEHQDEFFLLSDPYLENTGGQFAIRKLQ